MTVPVYNFNNELFRIEKIDYLTPVPRHKHSCYELFFILKGEGTFFIDCQHYDLQENSFFLVAPERIHGWEYAKGLEGYLIKFQHSIFMDLWIKHLLIIFRFLVLILLM